MSDARRKLLGGLALLFAIGVFIGWLYDRPVLGLLIAALVSLAWQTRQLLAFEKAVRLRNYDSLRYGEGIWSQIFSRMEYFRLRSKKYKKQYRSLLKEIRKSANAIPDGGIVLNRDLEILTCNPAAQELVGFKPRQDRGQRVDNILRDPKFGDYLRAGKYDSSVEVMSPVGDGRWLNCRIVPFGADQHLLLIRDVTERIKLNKIRREFIANASHELRSPLTVISGYLDTLVSDSELPASWDKPVTRMQEQAERMNTIITELLELSRLEAPRDTPAAERVDICGLLAAAKKSYADQAGIAKIEMECNSRAAVLGSTAEIESIIGNLLSNAIRHTPPSGTVTLTWSSSADGGELQVSDTGEGIDQDDIPRLTERFFRVDRGRSREDGGVGLGLAIVKHALSRHDADLDIQSEIGAGSDFICRFPADRLIFADLIELDRSKQSSA